MKLSLGKMRSRRVLIPAVILLAAGLSTLTLHISRGLHPVKSPFRSDVVTFTNDIGERIVVLKSTVSYQPKETKDVFQNFVKLARDRLDQQSKATNYYDFASCSQISQLRSEAQGFSDAATSWSANQFAGNLVSHYNNLASQRTDQADSAQAQCDQEVADAESERKRVNLEDSAEKRLIRHSKTQGSHARTFPQLKFKALLTDVNGKTIVYPSQITCLGPDALNVFDLDTRKSLAPHACIQYEKPQQVNIIDSQEATRPSEDAINLVSQATCSYKGYMPVDRSIADLAGGKKAKEPPVEGK